MPDHDKPINPSQNAAKQITEALKAAGVENFKITIFRKTMNSEGSLRIAKTGHPVINGKENKYLKNEFTQQDIKKIKKCLRQAGLKSGLKKDYELNLYTCTGSFVNVSPSGIEKVNKFAEQSNEPPSLSTSMKLGH